MYWIAGFFALLEFCKWIWTTKDFWLKALGFKTKGMVQREQYEQRLKNVEDSITEIKNTSKRNVDMFLDHERQVVDRIIDIKHEIVSELNKVHDKLDEQKEEMDKTNEENRASACIVLRDRLNSGMRYFSQNVCHDGAVHISLGDYENMEEMFQDYFKKGGNGAYKKAYETEFQKFVIDR